jgi:CTP-dependent riboflavin kinase
VTSVHGVVTSGLGQGAAFMGLPWVQDAVAARVGFVPYPGTLNVRLDREMVEIWRQMKNGHGVMLQTPASAPCGATLVPVELGGVTAAVIVPDVTRHGDDLLELIAPVHVRSLLGLRDGDGVTVSSR